MTPLAPLLSGLPPGVRRWGAIGIVVVGLASVLVLAVGHPRGIDLAARRANTVNSVLLSGDTRQVSMAGLAAQLQDAQERARRDEGALGDLRKDLAHTAQLVLQQMRAMVAQSDEKTRVETEHGLAELQDRVNQMAAGAGLPALPPEPLRPRPSAPKPAASPEAPARRAEPASGWPGVAGPSPSGATGGATGAAPGAVHAAAGAAAPSPVQPIAFAAHPPALGAAGAPRPLDFSAGTVFGGGPPASPAAVAPATARGGMLPGPAGGPGSGYRYVTGTAPAAADRTLPPADGIPDYAIPVGAILTGTIITGLDAPTAQGSRRDPFPVLIRLRKDAILPNRYRADVRECFLLAAGFGDLSSERVYLRSEQISCILRDGSTFQSKLQGYVADESGKNGVRGRVVSRQGAFIARAILVGVMQGIAQAFSQTGAPMVGYGGTADVSSLRVYGSNLQYGGSMGMGDAFQMIAQFYLNQASDMFLVIEVSAGREVDIVLTAGVRLKLPA